MTETREAVQISNDNARTEGFIRETTRIWMAVQLRGFLREEVEAWTGINVFIQIYKFPIPNVKDVSSI